MRVIRRAAVVMGVAFLLIRAAGAADASRQDGALSPIPLLLESPRPVYPPIAASAQIQGTVIVEAGIEPTGRTGLTSEYCNPSSCWTRRLSTASGGGVSLPLRHQGSRRSGWWRSLLSSTELAVRRRARDERRGCRRIWRSCMSTGAPPDADSSTPRRGYSVTSGGVATA